MAKRNEHRYVALYERLSHDDEQQGESNSIINQKRILEDYALSHGMTVFRHFTDDGISGTRFDRPERIANRLEKDHNVDARCISGNFSAKPDGIYLYKKVRCHNRQDT